MGNMRMVVLFSAVAAALLHAGGQTPTLGIAPAQIRGEIDYIALARWLGMMTMPILFNGYFLSRCRNVEVLSLLQLKNICKWMYIKLTGCFFNTLIYTTALAVPLCILRGFSTTGAAFLLLLGNNVLWMCVQLLLDEMLPSVSITSIVVVVMICACFVIGERLEGASSYMPSNWGMLCRVDTNPTGSTDIHWFLLANMVGILISLFVLFFVHGGKYGNH